MKRTKQYVCLFVLVFLVGVTVVAQTQKPSSEYHRITRSEMADTTKVRKVDSLLRLYVSQGKKDSVEYSASRYSNWLVLTKKPADFLKSAKVYDLVLEYNSRTKEVLQQRFYSSGLRYKKAGLDKKSIEAFEKAILLIKDSKWAVESYMGIAARYYDLGDYQLSSEYYRQAEQLSISLGNKEQQIRCYINSYKTLSRLNTKGSREKMRQNILDANEILKNFEISPKRSFYMLRVAGLYYSDNATKDTEKGAKYLLKAVEMAEDLNDSLDVADTYQNLAVLYARESPEKGIEYSQLGLTYTQEGDTNQRSVLFATMGLSKAYINDFDSAIKNLNRAVIAITGKDFQNSSEKEIKQLLIENASNDNLWVILGDLGQTYLKRYELQSRPEDIDNALKQFSYVDAIFDQLQQNSTNTTSKFLWRRKATELYSLAIRASYLKNDLGLVFRFMEKSKALVLLDEMRSRNAMIDSKMPEEMVFRIAHLKSEIAALENETTSEALQSEKLLETKRKLIRLTDSLKSNYTSYTAHMYTSSALSSLEEAKSGLQDNQCILELHLSSDDGFGLVTSANVGYGLLMDKTTARVFEIPDLLSLKQAVAQLQTLLSRPFKNESDVKKFQKISHSVYKRLFPSDEIRASIKGKDLKIISDDFLSVIPLEALSVSDESDNIKYLIEETNCYYSYSITFDSNLQSTSNKNLSFLAMAPVQFDSHDLTPLTHSLLEVNEIEEIFNGTSFVRGSASKANFIENQKKHQILHLATHANAADSIIPWIAFSDEKLNLNELYQLNNNADLVVLSACNTSTGVYASGEGVLSLSRGFFFGGAQSVVSSLWKVDDVATSELMKSFYKQLDQGENKSQALHKAKLDFLTTHSGREASPYFWSTFILTGNTTALDLDRQASVWWFVPAGMVIIFLLLMMKKRSMQKDPISN